jgi:hypothetical protein
MLSISGASSSQASAVNCPKWLSSKGTFAGLEGVASTQFASDLTPKSFSKNSPAFRLIAKNSEVFLESRMST